MVREAIYYVYRIVNTVNNKIYVGITKDVAQRWHLHKQMVSVGPSKNALYQDMRTYGIDKFSIEVIEGGMPCSESHGREEYWIDNLPSVHPYGYNMDRGSLKRLRIKAAKERPWELDDTAPRPVVRKEQEG